MEKHTCQKRIWDRFNQYTCGKTAKAESNGQWFCGIHSPEAEAKRKAKSDARSAERSRQRNDKDRLAKLTAFKLECFDEMLQVLIRVRARMQAYRLDTDAAAVLDEVDALIEKAHARSRESDNA